MAVVLVTVIVVYSKQKPWKKKRFQADDFCYDMANWFFVSHTYKIICIYMHHNSMWVLWKDPFNIVLGGMAWWCGIQYCQVLEHIIVMVVAVAVKQLYYFVIVVAIVVIIIVAVAIMFLN